MFIREVMPLYIRTRCSAVVNTLAVPLFVFVCGRQEYWQTVQVYTCYEYRGTPVDNYSWHPLFMAD